MIKTNNCFLAIDKPEGISSFAVIRQLRKLTGIRKIGHTGTLDPFATGLLICCLGSYTRLASFIEAEDKSYLASVKLGEKTTTGDPEGEVVETAAVSVNGVNWQELEKAALSLNELPIPAFSAVKVNGERAYSLARKGEAPDLPMRQTRISEFEFIQNKNGKYLDQNGCIHYKCTVSKGTYIRSLSEWLAGQLTTLGYTLQLTRISVGNLALSSAIPLGRIEGGTWEEYGLNARKVLGSIPALELDDQQQMIISHGGDIDLPFGQLAPRYALYCGDELVAIAEPKNDKLHPSIVL